MTQQVYSFDITQQVTAIGKGLDTHHAVFWPIENSGIECAASLSEPDLFTGLGVLLTAQLRQHRQAIITVNTRILNSFLWVEWHEAFKTSNVLIDHLFRPA